MNIDIVCVGKIKEKYFRDALAEYQKRLGRYCRLRILEAADEPTKENASREEKERILTAEGSRILRLIPENAYVIALAILGKKYDSPGMASMLEGLMNRGSSSIVFVIGGSMGLSDEVLQRADHAMSFSDLTFPHQMMRVILMEQIYRSFRIMRGEPYHK